VEKYNSMLKRAMKVKKPAFSCTYAKPSHPSASLKMASRPAADLDLSL